MEQAPGEQTACHGWNMLRWDKVDLNLTGTALHSGNPLVLRLDARFLLLWAHVPYVSYGPRSNMCHGQAPSGSIFHQVVASSAGSVFAVTDTVAWRLASWDSQSPSFPRSDLDRWGTRCTMGGGELVRDLNSAFAEFGIARTPGAVAKARYGCRLSDGWKKSRSLPVGLYKCCHPSAGLVHPQSQYCK